MEIFNDYNASFYVWKMRENHFHTEKIRFNYMKLFTFHLVLWPPWQEKVCTKTSGVFDLKSIKIFKSIEVFGFSENSFQKLLRS